MCREHMLAVLLVTLPILACGGGAPYRMPSAEQGGLGDRAPGPTPRVLAEEEEWSTLVYVVADSLDGIPGPAGIFSGGGDVDAGGEAPEPEPAFIWHQDVEVTRCYQTSDGGAYYCCRYQLATEASIGGKGRLLKRLFEKIFDRLSKSRQKARTPTPTRHLLGSVEAWRKPMLAPDKRIYPYRKTRDSASPIPNLGLNRAGKTISDGRHTISFDNNGFPRFNTRFETLLDDVHIGTGNRQAHIKASNESLARAIREDSGLAKGLGLSADDVAALPKSHQAPNGYRWHHHQDVGRMQLVKFEEHRLATPHTGGMAIWGGGYQ